MWEWVTFVAYFPKEISKFVTFFKLFLFLRRSSSAFQVQEGWTYSLQYFTKLSPEWCFNQWRVLDDFLIVGFLEESLVKKSVALSSDMLNQFYALTTKTLVGCKIHSLHKFSALEAKVSQRAEWVRVVVQNALGLCPLLKFVGWWYRLALLREKKCFQLKVRLKTDWSF